jgi:hypothetical protein
MSAHLEISLPILPDLYYHIYNRGNEKRHIFFNRDNYSYFLKKYAEYTVNYFDTYSYCLLFNHFHLLVKPKSADEILAAAKLDFETVDATFYNRYVLAWVAPKEVEQLSHGRDLTVLKELLNLMSEVDGQNLQTRPGSQDTAHHPTHMEQLDFKAQLCSYILSERLRRFLLSYAKSINKQQSRTGSLFQKAFHRKHVYGIEDLKRVSAYIHHNVIHHNVAPHYQDYPWSSYKTLISDSKTKLDKSNLLLWHGGVEGFINYSQDYKNYKWEVEQFYIEENE